MVIDLKTSKYPPTDKDLPSNPQLGIYQHAVRHGAVDDLVADVVEGPACPGAPSSCSCARRWRAGPRIQRQDPQEPDADGHRVVEVQLMRRPPRWPAARSSTPPPGKHCDHCQFHAICPTKAAGTVLS